MSDFNVEKCDGAALSLTAVYQKLGEYAVVIRTGTDGRMRVIGPRRDVTILSEFLHKCADALFDGVQVTTRNVN